ncbi:MAG: hypothetical protein CL847_02200 [Crocinitomicaceae bacterium]|nr:hypothetical protein [Crocinitomicaceae bacterium]
MKIASVITLLFILLVWGCRSSEENSTVSKEIVSMELAPFNIDTCYVVGDTLHASVSYSGGCGNHKFLLESNGVLLKSLPPKQPLRLEHRSDVDPCRSMIIENLKFDISDYRGTPHGTTILMLENWNTTLSYSY